MVQGLDKLQRRLVDVIPKRVRTELEKAMLESATDVARMARNFVPIDTGELRSTIRVTPIRETKGGNLAISVLAGDETTQVGARKQFQLARIVEFGTQERDPTPFMFPAFRANKRPARVRIRRAVRDAIVKAG